MWVYKHTNGEFKKVPDVVVDPALEYFDSPYVEMYKYFETEKEADLFIKEQEE